MPSRMRILVLVAGLLAVVATLWPRLAASRGAGNHQGYAPAQPIAYSHRLHAGELGIACLYCHFGAETSRHAGIPPANVCMNCHRSVASTAGARAAAREDLVAVADAAQAAHESAIEAGRPADELQRLAAAAEASKRAVDEFNPAGLLSPEIDKLYAAVGFDPATGTYDRQGTRRPIRWVQVHRVPDFVYFDHRAHVAAGVSCQICHGPVETMERMRQHSTLSMGWCVECHRDPRAQGVTTNPVPASLDCSACHY